MSDNEIEWVELQATAHVMGWDLHERKPGNVKDPETRALIEHGLLVVVDEETAKRLPPPNKRPGKGCGCHKR